MRHLGRNSQSRFSAVPTTIDHSMRPIRKEMVESQLSQLRESLGGGCPPVARKQLWAMYNEKNFAGIVKFVRDSMNLDLQIRVGLSNVDSQTQAPAWVQMPSPMPLLGTPAFKQTLATVFLSKSFLRRANFDQVVLAVAHEISHIVLNSTNHALRDEETAVDLTAMLLGYRDFYVGGCESVHIERKWLSRVETHAKQLYGYLTPDEVRYADRILVRRFGLSRFGNSHRVRTIALLSILAFLAAASLWIGLLARSP
jgi:hypothetical protein